MKLESIELSNFRLFSELRCDFHPSLTVLVANNGGGKTSILDAIRVLFDAYLSAFPSGKGAGIKVQDVRQLRSHDELALAQHVFPARVSARGTLTGESSPIEWSYALNTAKSKATRKDAKVLSDFAQQLQQGALRQGDTTNWPLLAFYGTGRLWRHKSITAAKQFSMGFNSREGAYIDCMDPASSFKYFSEWYRYAYRAVIAKQHFFMRENVHATRDEILSHQSAFSPLITAVQNAVNTVLAPSGWKNIAYSSTLDDITAEHDEIGTMSVGQLSDGIRTTLALAADIAYRAVQLNPHLGNNAARQTSGVVLIDEVDMHLHPSWQQVILASLQEAFPRLQFIVTTHSPQVLTSVDASCIRQLRQEQQGHGEFSAKHILQQTKGVASSDILAEIMNVDPVPPVQEARMLDEYHALIQQNLHESLEGKEMRSLLESHFGGRHPVMLDCDSMIRLQQFKQRLPDFKQPPRQG
ncbi:MAG: AAA family ATPase [Burkholderiaceae bacterium]|nr:AAA family ATPase [Burkholderiaceae bacterium]